MPTQSYYEQLCQKRTQLYPQGVQNSLMVQYARQAEFGRNLQKPAISPVSKRKKKVIQK